VKRRKRSINRESISGLVSANATIAGFIFFAIQSCISSACTPSSFAHSYTQVWLFFCGCYFSSPQPVLFLSSCSVFLNFGQSWRHLSISLSLSLFYFESSLIMFGYPFFHFHLHFIHNQNLFWIRCNISSYFNRFNNHFVSFAFCILYFVFTFYGGIFFVLRISYSIFSIWKQLGKLNKVHSYFWLY